MSESSWLAGVRNAMPDLHRVSELGVMEKVMDMQQCNNVEGDRMVWG